MRCHSTHEAIAFLKSKVSGTLKVGTPLGLGKPNILLNELYKNIKADPSRQLEVYTALSLDPPRVQGFLAERFFKPFADRHFGPAYPRLEYVNDLLADKVPDHIRIHEFFLQAGLFKDNPHVQRNYISLNYTHATSSLLDRGLNCLLQIVSRGPDGKLSLSCNPDITLDLVDMAKARGLPFTTIAVIHNHLPYLGRTAEVPEDYFDVVLEGDDQQHELFALPRMPVEVADYFIGLHASHIPKDDGTLQIGIGGLSDSLCYALVLRQQKNPIYRQLLEKLELKKDPINFHQETFTKGLYGMSEMITDGFMHLRRAGVLTRSVSAPGDRQSRFLHGGFFLGSKIFYQWLRDLEKSERDQIDMTRISQVNDLYDDNEPAVRAQLKHSRFFNTAMQVSLLGETYSDTLEDGRVISGVGGQYNFAAMARELADARSVILMHSTRLKQRKTFSNIVFKGSNSTISRHLRDIVITEYGLADLRGRTDEECAKAMIEISDAQFQDELLKQAVDAKKISTNWKIPERARKNTAQNLNQLMQEFKSSDADLFPQCPFGSDLDDVELKLVTALQALREGNRFDQLRSILRGLSTRPFPAEMKRMDLEEPLQFSERLQRLALKGALESNVQKASTRPSTM